jgi:hypothetical protein
MEELHTELYHSGKNYVASIVGGKNGKYNDYLYSISNISQKDRYEDTILKYASLMICIMDEDNTSLDFCRGTFTCSLIYRKCNNSYREYIFITKRDEPYIFPEEIICKKYNIEPTLENQEKIKISIERRTYSYKQRDFEKKKRCITFEEAEKLKDYLINIQYFDVDNVDNELKMLKYLNGKNIYDLTQEQKKEVSNYITKTLYPILLYKEKGDSKLLVNKLPEFQSVSYKELCDILISNKDECFYCKCKIILLNGTYIENGLTFDAIIPLEGHHKDNIALCCSLCNSTKSFKNKLDI